MTKRIGVFGGTFNPIHWGHLFMAERALEQAELERVLFITSPNPPHRRDDLLEAEHRHELVVAAVADNPNFEPSRLELDRAAAAGGGAPSFTIDTLEILQNQFGPDYELNLIVGQDNLNYLGQWHRADDIFKMCRLLVAPRARQPAHEGAPQEEKLPPPDARVFMLNHPQIPVSSSSIRDRLATGQSVLYMVPMEVEKILRAKNYYGNASPMTVAITNDDSHHS